MLTLRLSATILCSVIFSWAGFLYGEFPVKTPWDDNENVDFLLEGDRLRFVQADGLQNPDELADWVSRFKTVKEVEVRRCMLTDKGAAKFLQLPLLECAYFEETSVTGKCLESFRGSRLRELSIDNASVSLAGMKAVCTPSLTHLYLASATMENGALGAIAGANRLETLVLRNSSVRDADLTALESNSIDYLALTNTRVSDIGVSELSRLKSLKCLDLCETDIRGLTLDHLPQLESLHISDTEVGDAGFGKLTRLRKLNNLIALNCPVSNLGLRALVGATSLTELSVDGIAIDDRTVDALLQIEWETLSVSERLVSKKGMQRLRQGLPDALLTEEQFLQRVKEFEKLSKGESSDADIDPN